MPSTEERKEEAPVVEDTLLDQLGEMWARENKKAFPTFLAYLNYQVYGLEHTCDRRSRRPEEQEMKKIAFNHGSTKNSLELSCFESERTAKAN